MIQTLLLTWTALAGLGLGSLFTCSGGAFYHLYVNASPSTWRWKTSAKYPSVVAVRAEIRASVRGIFISTFCPALSIALLRAGYGRGYLSLLGSRGWAWALLSSLGSWLATDLFEWAYHRLGHTTSLGWSCHKAHHKFPNPTPFAVLADDWLDQLMRSVPLLAIPLFAPVSAPLVFAQFALVFNAYGTYLHCGHEHPSLSAHNPLVLTSYHHLRHHHLSGRKNVLYTGFTLLLWDRVLGATELPSSCACARCSQMRGLRVSEKFPARPDYSVLWSRKFWMQ